MNEKLYSILKQAVTESGEAILNDAEFMGELLTETATVVPKNEQIILMLALATDCHIKLRMAGEVERITVKKQLAEDLYINEGLDISLCNTTMNLLCAVLFGVDVVPETEDANKKQTEEIKRLNEIIAEKTEQNGCLINALKFAEQKRIAGLNTIKALKKNIAELNRQTETRSFDIGIMEDIEITESESNNRNAIKMIDSNEKWVRPISTFILIAILLFFVMLIIYWK